MEMQTHEIVRMYKEAADKKKQIVILSQMNLCTPEEIREELVKGGIDPRTLPRKRKQPGEKKAEETTADPAASAVLIPMADAPLVREALLFYAGDIQGELAERRKEVVTLEQAAGNIVRIVNSIEKQSKEVQPQ